MRLRLLLAAVLAVAATAPALAEPFATDAASPATQSTRDRIDALIEKHARANKVPPEFVHRVVKRESNYNPNAKGGSALGLMQIKAATARGMGYNGDSAGLLDPGTNLKYGIAYLAGAYHAAQGNLDQAYRYYNRGYYYVAKRLGIDNSVEDGPPAVASAQTASGFASLFGADAARASAATPAMAYASVAPAAVDVPLPPSRPVTLAGAGEQARQVAAAESGPVAAASAPNAAPPAAAAVSDALDVPLPPRRPAVIMLAAIAHPAKVALRKSVSPDPVLEAAALPPTQ